MHTLIVLGKKLYIVGAPQYITAISRAAKTISFTPFVSELGIRITGADQATRQIIERDLSGPNKRNGYVSQIHDQTIALLAAGPDLDQITRDMVGGCVTSLQARDGKSADATIDLYAFIRNLVTISSTTAIYGPESPFARDSSIEEAFWSYIADLNMLLLNACPSVTARKGQAARQKVATAFASYFSKAENMTNASAYANMRRHLGTTNGVDWLNLGRLETGGLIGILVNTVPTTFFLLLHAFASSSLLQDIREELEQNAVTRGVDGRASLSLSAIRERCSLLESVYKETLRVHSENASARFIMEDTQLDSRFTLKKGSILLMPNSVLHRDSNTWGDIDFQPRRFLKLDSVATNGAVDETGVTSSSDGSKRATTAAYRPFGGGSTLCPGRHFAANEVLGLAAMIFWRFDITPEARDLVIPGSQQQSVVEAIIPPKHDLKVKLRPREGVSRDWDFTL